MRCPEGFTSRRRRYLAKKVDRIDRIETRNTMTEPISVLGLMTGSLCWLEQLGLVDRSMLGNPLSGLARPDQAAAKVQPQATIQTPINSSVGAIGEGIRARGPKTIRDRASRV
jgi:hypothetical protein